MVTGYGCVTPLGTKVQECWNSISDYVAGYALLEPADRSINARFVGKVQIDPKRFKTIPASVRRALPLFAKYTAIAAQEAIGTAFKDASPSDI